MTKGELIKELADNLNGFTRSEIKDVIDEMEEVIAAALEDGEDIKLPNIVNITYRYTPARKKGEKYKKGDTYSAFGEEKTAEADSPASVARITLKPSLVGWAKEYSPRNQPEAQKEFFKSSTGKAVVKRKA